MKRSLVGKGLESIINNFLQEDDIGRNLYYSQSLPTKKVICHLKLKSQMILSGLPFLCAVFENLGFGIEDQIDFKLEGQSFSDNLPYMISFEAPFDVALTGERLALNLLQRSCSISTYTHDFVAMAKPHKIKILDTRKTMPGLRWLDKYAVRLGGGYNHRFGQADTWMIKDNHKEVLGGLEGAYEFFKGMGSNYNNVVVEIHNMEEFEAASKLGILNVMLDNFTPTEVRQVCRQKPPLMHIEVSGGMTIDKIKGYFIDGVDAISVGGLTYDFPRQDISLKFES